ncbi:MAG: amidohydrolase family protein [Cytophagaceae bacterium]|nr:amidohydrolase family protein [Gemmatimonadaceae bacterium]
MPFRPLSWRVQATRRFAVLLAVLLPAAAAAQGRPIGTYARGPLRLVLTDSSFRVQLGEELGAAGTARWRGDSMVVLTDTAGPRACRAGEAGSYAVAARGDSLRFTAVSEACAGRRGVFAGGAFVKPTLSVHVLNGVTLVDGTGAAARAGMSLVIRAGRIAEIYPTGSRTSPAGARVEDLAGRWVIPGLIDAHVHLATDPSGDDNRAAITAKLRSELRGGVTSVRDMAGDARALGELARGTLVGDIEGPDIFGSAIWAGADFMSDPRVGASTKGTTAGVEPWMRTVSPTTDFRSAALEAKGSGVRGIKLYADASADVVRGAVPAAHAAGLRVWSHATLFPARPSDLVDAGVDVLSHAPLLAWEGVDSLPNYRQRYAVPYARVEPGAPAITRLLQRMAERQVLFEPTLFVFLRANTPREAADWAVAVTRRAAELGVPIVAGTDDMIATHSDSLPHLHRELVLLVSAGLTPMQALQAATFNAARAIGIEERTGTLRPGLAADLVVLGADPLADIRNTQKVERVMKRGTWVKR